MRISTAFDVSKNFDLVIIGGGCSGLSLAMELCRYFDKAIPFPRTLIIEPRSHYINDRSWCFWDLDDQIDTELVSKSWQVWEFSSELISHKHSSLEGWSYHHVPSSNFYDKAEKIISKNPHIKLQKNSRVVNETYSPDHIGLTLEIYDRYKHTESLEITTNLVVDTRIPPEVDFSVATLKQIFYGFEIKTKNNHKLEDNAMVMSNMRVDADGFLFDYILPLGHDSLLIELTRFAVTSIHPKTLRTNALELVNKVCGDSAYKIVREESGLIPMGIPRPEKIKDHRIIFAGLGAGAARPSTGYAFRRIQNWAKICAKEIISKGKAANNLPDKNTLKWMDSIFLRTIRKNPKIAPMLFMKLAQNVQADVLVRFLADKPNKSDLASIIFSLPIMPLMSSAFMEFFAQIQATIRNKKCL
jgi:lycopene beta-cyclase